MQTVPTQLPINEVDNMKAEYKQPRAYFEIVLPKDIITLSSGQDGEGFKTSWDNQISLGDGFKE